MKLSTPACALLNDGRLHLQHGPIDLIIEAFAADRREITMAYEQASMRFSSLLASLVTELPQLRTALSKSFPIFADPVAQRMAVAVWPYREQFITPMAAVAGAVADEILQALTAGRDLHRAYVNNGGDIALHLAPGENFEIGIAGVVDTALHGQFVVRSDDNVRGVATSGWRGRSFSLGIADSVTVLAANAAQADAAATMIANAVNVEDPDIDRVPACDIVAESDLGKILVTRGVPVLPGESICCALDAGALAAEAYLSNKLIAQVAIRLQGQIRVLPTPSFPPPTKALEGRLRRESSGVSNSTQSFSTA